MKFDIFALNYIYFLDYQNIPNYDTTLEVLECDNYSKCDEFIYTMVNVG